MLNRVDTMGRLTKDVLVTYAQGSNTAIGRFTIACERDYQREGEERKADFINCVAFDKKAEFISKHFKKGSMICVTGRLQTGSYTNQQGQTVYTTDVIVENAYFTGEKKADAEPQPAPEPSTAGDGFMNSPDNIEAELPF